MQVRHFPPEIWSIIFSFACTDDGFTGRSLSLVSKMFYHVSQPMQLTSVAVYGPDQLESFVSLLEKKPPHLRKVRHLLITDEERSFFGPLRESPPLISYTARDLIELMLPPLRDYSRTTSPLLLRIFSMVQSTLETLALLLPEYYYQDPIPAIPIDLPKLTELILDGTVQINSLKQSQTLPSLERLEIVSHDSLPSDFTPTFRKFAPRLAHLCVGSVCTGGEAGESIEALKTAIEVWSERLPREGETVAFRTPESHHRPAS